MVFGCKTSRGGNSKNYKLEELRQQIATGNRSEDSDTEMEDTPAPDDDLSIEFGEEG